MLGNQRPFSFEQVGDLFLGQPKAFAVEANGNVSAVCWFIDDDSSRRAIQNAFSLIYRLKLPSQGYEQYTFARQMNRAGQPFRRFT